MAPLFLFDSVFALEGEVVTDAKQVVVMATVDEPWADFRMAAMRNGKTTPIKVIPLR